MENLQISLFGPFRARLDGEEISEFRYDKVRALLAYLAMYADRSFRRQSLSALLWPEAAEQAAKGNLRNAIFYLRKALYGQQEDSTPSNNFLLVGQDTLQFNQTTNTWLDVAEFERLFPNNSDLNIKHPRRTKIDDLEKAVTLYRGGFLDGFFIDSPAFDEWLLFERDRLKERMLTALDQLAEAYEAEGDWVKAQHYARWQLRLEPYRETAHQRLMKALALSGQRGAAVAQYDLCQQVLARELGVAPSGITVALFRQIRAGGPLPSEGKRRYALQKEWEGQPADTFVAREGELSKLERHLQDTLAGQGRMVFVTGSPGSGKTALLEAFTHQMMTQYSDVVVVGSSCTAHYGIGEPYLPFIEILRTLSGDIETRRESGALSTDQANRLWELWPAVMQAIIEEGPGLVGDSLPAKELLTIGASFRG